VDEADQWMEVEEPIRHEHHAARRACRDPAERHAGEYELPRLARSGDDFGERFDERFAPRRIRRDTMRDLAAGDAIERYDALSHPHSLGVEPAPRQHDRCGVPGRSFDRATGRAGEDSAVHQKLGALGNAQRRAHDRRRGHQVSAGLEWHRIPSAVRDQQVVTRTERVEQVRQRGREHDLELDLAADRKPLRQLDREHARRRRGVRGGLELRRQLPAAGAHHGDDGTAGPIPSPRDQGVAGEIVEAVEVAREAIREEEEASPVSGFGPPIPPADTRRSTRVRVLERQRRIDRDRGRRGRGRRRGGSAEGHEPSQSESRATATQRPGSYQFRRRTSS
jgi:hypothetical protein